MKSNAMHLKGINYMKQKLNYAIPFDIWLAYENGDLPKKVPGKSGAVKVRNNNCIDTKFRNFQ